MSRRVYLHIGAPKTGTTYLQDRLALNAKSLSDHGVHFPTKSPLVSPGLFQFRAADAWPLLGFPEGIEAYDRLMVAGRPTLSPRLAPVPVRLPLPPASKQGSIYENQKGLKNRFFAAAAE